MRRLDDLAIVLTPRFLDHDGASGHPECPERIRPLMPLFEGSGRWAQLPRIGPREATSAELNRVHAEELIGALRGAASGQGWFDPDTYYGPRSTETALLAAGSCVEAVLAVLRGDHRRAFCLVRPPGHHATAERIQGFCLLNNVAVAVAALRAERPGLRVAIVDFDLHHGNGTQDLFYADPDVLFVSSHRYPFYPGTGALEEIGAGRGKGTTMNLPLPGRAGDAVVVPLYAELVAHALDEFKPDFVVVSAGFDAHAADPMQGLAVSTEGFAALTRVLVAAAEKRGGKILFCLEGGYNPLALRDCVDAVIAELADCPRAPFEPVVGSYAPEKIVDLLRRFHRGLFPTL